MSCFIRKIQLQYVATILKRGRNVKPSIYGLTKESLSLWMTEQEEKKFRTNQVWEWLYEKRVATFEEMTNLPKSLVTK